MQQHALVGVKRRVKPKPALGRKVHLHHHVGNQEAVFEHLALHVQPQLAAHRAARPVGHDQPVGLDGEAAFGCVHRHARTIGQRLHTHHLVLPAQVGAQRGGARHQRFFQVVLLQVDHARAVVPGVGHQIKPVHLFFAHKGAAHAPAHALLAQGLAHTVAVQNFQGALGVTHRPRAKRHAVVFVKQQHIQPAQARINRGAQAHRAGTNDDERAALGRALHQIGGAAVSECRVGIGAHVVLGCARDCSAKFNMRKLISLTVIKSPPLGRRGAHRWRPHNRLPDRRPGAR